MSNPYDVNCPVVVANGAGAVLSFAGTVFGAISICRPRDSGVDVWCKINGTPIAADVPGQFVLTDAIPSITLSRAAVTSVGVITTGSNATVQAVATLGEQS